MKYINMYDEFGIYESVSYKDVYNYLSESNQKNPTDNDSELAQRAISNKELWNAGQNLKNWSKDAAREILN